MERGGRPSELGRCRVGGLIGVMKITGSDGYRQGSWGTGRWWKGRGVGWGTCWAELGGSPGQQWEFGPNTETFLNGEGLGVWGVRDSCEYSSVELMEEIFLNGGGESDGCDGFA